MAYSDPSGPFWVILAFRLSRIESLKGRGRLFSDDFGWVELLKEAAHRSWEFPCPGRKNLKSSGVFPGLELAGKSDPTLGATLEQRKEHGQMHRQSPGR